MVLSIARLAKVAVKAAEGIDSQGKVCLVPVSPALPWLNVDVPSCPPLHEVRQVLHRAEITYPPSIEVILSP